MNSEGIGMGLMICRDLTELNRGQIHVHSDGEDLGSTFMFSLRMSKTNNSFACEENQIITFRTPKKNNQQVEYFR